MASKDWKYSKAIVILASVPASAYASVAAFVLLSCACAPAGAGLLQDVGHDQRHPGTEEVEELEGDAQVCSQRQQQLAAQLPQALRTGGVPVCLLRPDARIQHMVRELGTHSVQRCNELLLLGGGIRRLLLVNAACRAEWVCVLFD